MTIARSPVVVLAIALGCFSCASNAKFGLTDGRYDFKHQGEPFKKVDVYLDETDSIRVFDKSNPVSIAIVQPQYFRKKSFDLDALAVPFKLRPISHQFPRQLTTDFNGNVYLGFRVDRFKVTYPNTPFGIKRKLNQIGFSGGVFAGLGSAAITPWTTNYRTMDEYNGFVLSRGLAFLVGLHNLTVGVGMGWDYLTDRDKDIWIYQNKPWYGLTVGLNVN
jgi:hypothetical protein